MSGSKRVLLRTTTVAIMLVSVVQMATNAVAPLLSEISAANPGVDDVTIQFLMTTPSLVVCVASPVAAIAARRFQKRAIAAAGCALFCLAGALSAVLHASLVALFALAALAGLGIGMVVPMATSLVVDIYEKSEQGTAMGLQSVAASSGAAVMTLLAGALSAVHWSYGYLSYLVALPGAVLAMRWIPGAYGAAASTVPAASDTPAAGGAPASGVKTSLMQPRALLCFLLAAAVTLLFNVLPTNVGMLLAEGGADSASTTSLATMILLGGGVVGGLLFGPISGCVGSRVVSVGFGALAVGHALVAASQGTASLFAGCLLAGMSISLVMPWATMTAADAIKGNSAAGTALVMSMSNLGGFAAPVVSALAALLPLGTGVAPRLVLSACLGAAAVLAWLVASQSKPMFVEEEGSFKN